MQNISIFHECTLVTKLMPIEGRVYQNPDKSTLEALKNGVKYVQS